MGRERIVMTLRLASPCDMQEKKQRKMGSQSEVYVVVFTVYYIATSFGFHQKPSGIYKTPTEIRKIKK